MAASGENGREGYGDYWSAMVEAVLALDHSIGDLFFHHPGCGLVAFDLKLNSAFGRKPPDRNDEIRRE